MRVLGSYEWWRPEGCFKWEPVTNGSVGDLAHSKHGHHLNTSRDLAKMLGNLSDGHLFTVVGLRHMPNRVAYPT